MACAHLSVRSNDSRNISCSRRSAVSSGWNADTMTHPAGTAPAGRRPRPGPRRRRPPLDDRGPDEHGVEAARPGRRRRGRPRRSRPGARTRCGARPRSMAPKARWSGRPSRTSVASRIIPAQVPKAGIPSARRSASGAAQLVAVEQHRDVVDSPPGRTSRRRRPARPGCGPRPPPRRAAQSAQRGRPTPPAGPARRCAAAAAPGGSITSPGRRTVVSSVVDLEAGHGLAEAPADLGQDVGVAEVGGRLDDGLGHQRRVRRS